MLDNQTFKIVINSTPLISIDLLVKNNNKILLGKRINKPALGFFSQLEVEFIKMKQLIMQ